MSTSSRAATSEGIIDRLIRRLRVSDPPERFQKRAASAIRSGLDAEAAAWVPDSGRETIVTSGEVAGFGTHDYRSLGRGCVGEPVKVETANDEQAMLGLRRYIVVSLEGAGGRLIALNPGDGRPSRLDIEKIQTVASLIGTQRSNARIYTDLKELLFGVIRALTSAIDAKDPYTSGHSERVARIAVRIGRELGMSAHDQGDLYLMGLLHDVGKIGSTIGCSKSPAGSPTRNMNRSRRTCASEFTYSRT